MARIRWFAGLAALVLAAPLAGVVCGTGQREPVLPEARGAGPAPSGRSRSAPGDEGRRALVRFPSGATFSAEIADTPERVARGYMFRPVIGERDAMIFVFPIADVHTFWMKNTLVPLDMLWLDERFTVIHMETGVPPCRADPCPSYGTPRKVRHVLEVRGGTVEREKLRVGDAITIAFPEEAD